MVLRGSLKYREKGLTTKTVFQGEELRVKFRQRSAKLGQFLFRTMNLEASELDHLQRFIEQLSDVLEMRQNSLGVGITFPAMSFVSAEAESVVKALWFCASLRDKLFTKALEGWQGFTRHLKVGNDRAALILGRHLPFLVHSANHGAWGEVEKNCTVFS